MACRIGVDHPGVRRLPHGRRLVDVSCLPARPQARRRLCQPVQHRTHHQPGHPTALADGVPRAGRRPPHQWAGLLIALCRAWPNPSSQAILSQTDPRKPGTVRLTELLLFLTPFALLVVWRLTAGVGGPPRALLVAAAGAL